MTTISLTSGEIMDIIEILGNQPDEKLARYFAGITQQFDSVLEKLQTLPGEEKVATLVMAMN